MAWFLSREFLMTTLILDPIAEEQILADRRAQGLDRYDEVWEGIYIMSPLANNEHQKLALRLASIMDSVVDLELGGLSYCGCNVSDQTRDWKLNYRCPDVAVFLATTTAKDRGAYWEGGPDFAIEITSPGDRTWEKLDFYAKVHTRELLIVEREPWALILLRWENGTMQEVSRSTLSAPCELIASTIPFVFRLVTHHERPVIDVQHQHDGRRWLATGGSGN
jgi:Uma2 family endonuclease